jgi:hypothetical protein
VAEDITGHPRKPLAAILGSCDDGKPQTYDGGNLGLPALASLRLFD